MRSVKTSSCCALSETRLTSTSCSDCWLAAWRTTSTLTLPLDNSLSRNSTVPCHSTWSLRELYSSYHIISGICSAPIRDLLREPRPLVHYKSQPDAKAQRETLKSTNVKSLTEIEWFKQFSELDKISHCADVVGQSVPGGRTRMWERPLAELRTITRALQLLGWPIAA